MPHEDLLRNAEGLRELGIAARKLGLVDELAAPLRVLYKDLPLSPRTASVIVSLLRVGACESLEDLLVGERAQALLARKSPRRMRRLTHVVLPEMIC